ncbi:hypothetical protein GPECTOR_128g549 [Gonium pectorale]|uniref:MYND-type domain-containing protein n=1 Tax=Gonium pectorale TaxID=33097 RepID=A0A150FYF3_GONPE|nr:hypothetical protein GPECTOR_128g549 [Gonium pectorale]|eukprot:KXZ42646.1 hypothetical protein GPECTOR_128g549 [Gonium pectorale]
MLTPHEVLGEGLARQGRAAVAAWAQLLIARLLSRAAAAAAEAGAGAGVAAAPLLPFVVFARAMLRSGLLRAASRQLAAFEDALGLQSAAAQEAAAAAPAAAAAAAGGGRRRRSWWEEAKRSSGGDSAIDVMLSTAHAAYALLHFIGHLPRICTCPWATGSAVPEHTALALEMVAALRDSAFPEHAARAQLLLAQLVPPAGDGPGVGTMGQRQLHVTLSTCRDSLAKLTLLAYHMADGEAPQPVPHDQEAATVAAASSVLQQALSGRCVHTARLYFGVAALCMADGGPAYGLPPPLLAAAAVALHDEGQGGAGGGGGEADGGAGSGALLSASSLSSISMLLPKRTQPVPLVPPGKRAVCALALRIGRLALASLPPAAVEPKAAAAVEKEAELRSGVGGVGGAGECGRGGHDDSSRGGGSGSTGGAEQQPFSDTPPPLLAAALDAGLLPCLERLLRRAAREPDGPEAAFYRCAFTYLSSDNYVLLAMLLAYGDPRQAAALVATLAKLARATDPRVTTAAWAPKKESGQWLLSFVCWTIQATCNVYATQLQMLQDAASASPDTAAMQEGLRQQRAAAEQPNAPAPALALGHGSLRVLVPALLPSLFQAAQLCRSADMAPDPAPATTEDASGSEDPTFAGWLSLLLEEVCAVELLRTALELVAAGAWDSLAPPQPSPVAEANQQEAKQGEPEEGQQEGQEEGPDMGEEMGPEMGPEEGQKVSDGTWDVLWLVDACKWVAAVLAALDTAASPPREDLERSPDYEAAGPGGAALGVGGSAAGTSAVAAASEICAGGGPVPPQRPLPPWRPGLLRAVAARLRAAGAEEWGAEAEELATRLDVWGIGGQPGCDGAGGVDGGAATGDGEVQAAPVVTFGTPLPHPAEARRLLRTCANPDCANLGGDSEADLAIWECCSAAGPGGGSGAARVYCCRSCKGLKWLAAGRGGRQVGL